MFSRFGHMDWCTVSTLLSQVWIQPRQNKKGRSFWQTWELCKTCVPRNAGRFFSTSPGTFGYWIHLEYQVRIRHISKLPFYLLNLGWQTCRETVQWVDGYKSSFQDWMETFTLKKYYVLKCDKNKKMIKNFT